MRKKIYKIKKLFFLLLKLIIIKIYSNLIILNILIIKKVATYKIFYSDLGFGDSFTYYLFSYNKIINKNCKILTFSHIDYNNAIFLFGKKKIIKLFFFIPKIFPIYEIISHLQNKKFFDKEKFISYKYTIRDKHKKLLKNKLFRNIHLVSKNLSILKENKYILFFIKYYDNIKNDISLSKGRQSNDFCKINKILEFFKKKKITIIIMGNHQDRSIPILRSIVRRKGLYNVKFFKDYSSYSVVDQIFLHYYSQGGIGSDSGAFVFSWFFKKKILHFDTFKSKESIALSRNKNIKFLYKKIYFDKINKEKVKLVVYNTYEEIKKNIYKHLIS